RESSFTRQISNGGIPRMIAKQSGVCAFAICLRIAGLVIGVCAPGVGAEASRRGVPTGYGHVADGDTKQDQGQDKDKKDEKKDEKKDDKKDEKKGLPLKPDR